ncbi:hypothetical protein AVEN_21744-1 [Araneus ventricosus]|uniref:Uncharacterized protein n=1 Tax=Araneus ventricosus TaxID=182803 RepID=A0A4Y2EYC0_ARAVE|nr:hypothetical protein AVEN_21744-1 [Araneus ventricosus]
MNGEYPKFRKKFGKKSLRNRRIFKKPSKLIGTADNAEAATNHIERQIIIILLAHKNSDENFITYKRGIAEISKEVWQEIVDPVFLKGPRSSSEQPIMLWQ